MQTIFLILSLIFNQSLSNTPTSNTLADSLESEKTQEIIDILSQKNDQSKYLNELNQKISHAIENIEEKLKNPTYNYKQDMDIINESRKELEKLLKTWDKKTNSQEGSDIIYGAGTIKLHEAIAMFGGDKIYIFQSEKPDIDIHTSKLLHIPFAYRHVIIENILNSVGFVIKPIDHYVISVLKSQNQKSKISKVISLNDSTHGLHKGEQIIVLHQLKTTHSKEILNIIQNNLDAKCSYCSGEFFITCYVKDLECIKAIFNALETNELNKQIAFKIFKFKNMSIANVEHIIKTTTNACDAQNIKDPSIVSVVPLLNRNHVFLIGPEKVLMHTINVLEEVEKSLESVSKEHSVVHQAKSMSLESIKKSVIAATGIKEDKIIIEDSTKKIFIMCDGQDTQKIYTLLNEIDIDPVFIATECTIIETTKAQSTINELGIDFSKILNIVQTIKSVVSMDAMILNNLANIWGIVSGSEKMSVALGYEGNNDAFIKHNFMNCVQGSKAQIIAVVGSQEGKKGLLRRGTEISVNTGHGESKKKNTFFGNSYSRAEYGLKLEILPCIDRLTDNISVDVKIALDNMTKNTSNVDRPEVTRRVLESNIITKNAMPVIVGCLKKSESTTSSSSPSWWSRWLIGKNINNTEETNLIFIITPKKVSQMNEKQAQDFIENMYRPGAYILNVNQLLRD